MIESVGRILFVSYFLFAAFDKMIKIDKYSELYNDRYSKYLEYHRNVFKCNNDRLWMILDQVYLIVYQPYLLLKLIISIRL